MNDGHSRPSGTDPSDLDVGSEGGNEEANASADRANNSDPLELVGGALGRKFASWEEAEKTLENLNSLVGDREIAGLRTRAQLGDAFEQLTQGYAHENNLSYENARAELMNLAGGDDGSDMQDTQQGNNDVAEIKQRLDRQDLLAEHPEAGYVLGELEALAYSTGASLADVYEQSQALQAAAAQMASSRDRENKGSILDPSQRIPGNAPGRKVTEAIESFKSNRQSGEAADALVAAALGIAK